MMTGLELRHWAISWGFDYGEASEAIGIGRSTFFKYMKALSVPENIRLATIGHDAEKKVIIDDKYKIARRKLDIIKKTIEGDY